MNAPSSGLLGESYRLVRHLAQIAPEAAFDQYAREAEFFSDDVAGIGGFREWPHDRGGGMDADSGPIVFGVGVAATGLGLGAARIFHDANRYAVIRRTALVAGLPSWIPSHGYSLAPLLGEAMLFNGRTACPWFGTVPHVDSRPPIPWVPLALTAMDVAALFALTRRVARNRRPMP